MNKLLTLISGLTVGVCCMTTAPSALAAMTVLLCEGADPLTPSPRVHRYSVAFDEARNLLTMNGDPLERNKRFDSDRIEGSSFFPLGSDSSIGTEYRMSINRVTSEFIYNTMPASADGSPLSGNQIRRILGETVGPIMITGSCAKAKAAF